MLLGAKNIRQSNYSLFKTEVKGQFDMNETVMNLSSDGRIVQIDNVSWSYYIDVDRARSLEDHKSGKWMHFFNDISFAAAI